MKSSEISQKLKDLELEASNIFSTLLKQKSKFNFLQTLSDYEGTDDEIEELLRENGDENLLPTIEVRNSFTGDVFDIHIISVDENDVFGMLMGDTSTKNLYKFSDLCSLDDRLVLLNEMEDLV